MRVWHGPGEIEPSWVPCVVAIGVFDGVHRGHMTLLARARDHARAAGQRLVVLTFDPHPLSVVRPAQAPELLGTVADRLRLLEDAGTDAVLVLAFTPELSAVPAAEFVRTVLVNALRASTVVVGEGFRFGHRAAGDVGTLRELGEGSGFVVDAVAVASDETDRYSSTRVRALLTAGEVGAAAEVLGRPYGLTGVVVEGQKRGRELGFPTANIACPPGIVVPPDGVYAGRLTDGVETWPAAISVGSNPTFEGLSRRVEAYALDRDDLELYGHEVSVAFVARLRQMVAFTSIEELILQITDDVERCRSVLAAQGDDSGLAAPR